METKTLLRRNARITAIVLGLSVIICIVFLVFAFVQKDEADKQRQIAEQLRTENAELRKTAEEFKTLAEQERLRSTQVLQAALQSSERTKEGAVKKTKK